MCSIRFTVTLILPGGTSLCRQFWAGIQATIPDPTVNLAALQFFDAGTTIADPNFGRSSLALAGPVELQARFVL